MRTTLSILALALLVSGVAYAADNAAPTPPPNPAPNAVPNPLARPAAAPEGIPLSFRFDPAFPSSNTEHLRVDESDIAKFGDGSFDKGLNFLGGAGFRLFGVTNDGDQGKVGWHIFKREAWNAPVPRPRFEYKRIDTDGIEKLGEGKFAAGMQKVEEDHWELVAFTSDKNGQIGWFYFERPVNTH